jgi:hypothetical protein
MERSSAALVRGAGEDALKNEIRAELVSAEREFTRAKLIMHTTTVLRAVKDAGAL